MKFKFWKSNKKMTISLIHPSRSRPDQAYNTFRNWAEKASDWNNFQYILSLDTNDSFLSQYVGNIETVWKKSCAIDFLPIINKNNSAIDAINAGAKIAKCDILLVLSDDTDCPEHWDTLLLDHLKGKSDFCAKVDDGLQPTLVTMPIMDRVYYERYGYIYESGYNHLFCDQELTAVAIMTGKYIKLPLLFPHNHYSTGRTPKDALNSRNDGTWGQGERLFNERLKTNFGIDNPVVPYDSIQWR